MTVDVAVQWVAFAACRPVEEGLAPGLTDDQFEVLGRWLSQNRLLNPPRPGLKQGVFVCQCGCGREFTAWYRTKRPLYLNDTHKMRVYRRRKRARARALSAD